MTARAKTGALAATLAAATLVLAACGEEQPAAGTVPSGNKSVDTTPTRTELSVTIETGVSVTIEPESTRPAPPMTLPGATDPANPPGTDPTAPSATSGPASTGVPDVDDAAAAAIADLAGRIGVEPSAVTVVSDGRVTWRDGSTGCPKPGMAYTQALVPGRRLILESGGERFAYHAGRSGPLTYCATPDPDGSAPEGPGTNT